MLHDADNTELPGVSITSKVEQVQSILFVAKEAHETTREKHDFIIVRS